MTSDQIVIPSLVDWTEFHLTAILNATKPEAVSEAIHNFFTEDARITVNGNNVSADEYAQYAGTIAFKDDAEVKYDAAVGIPKDQKEPTKAGIVGLFYEATVYSGILVFGAHESRKVSSSINVIIEQEYFPPGLEQPTDKRRVKVLNQVYLESPLQIPFPDKPIQH